jgi:hypothetical protein
VCQSANRLNPMKWKGEEEVAVSEEEMFGRCMLVAVVIHCWSNTFYKLRYSRPEYDVYYDDRTGS